MVDHTIQKSTIKFLKDLAKNNQRDWFEARRPVYEEAHRNMIAFADQLIVEMDRHDEIERTTGRKSLHRIYNDVRFSKDKSPYRARFSVGLQRATKLKRGGYYIHIEPGNSFMACGFFSPNPDDLRRIRMDIDTGYDTWRKLLKAKALKDNFGGMEGAQVSTAPKGFAKDHPAIDLLRYKQFLFRHNFTDLEVTANGFVKDVSKIYRSLRPWLDHMSEILTTDVNGESIV